MNDLIEQEAIDAKEVAGNERARLVIDAEIDLREFIGTAFHQEVAQLLGNWGVIVDPQWRPVGYVTEKMAYAGPVLVLKAITANADITGKKLAEAVRSLIPDKLRQNTRVWCASTRQDPCNETQIFDVVVAGVSAVLFEGAEEDEMKSISEPTDPKERIMAVLNGHGLHIESFITTPPDPGWGDLGGPVFVVKTNLQPNNAEWSSNPVADAGFVDFCNRVKANLEEITRQSVSFSTHFSTGKGAWEITWLTDEHKKMESTGDDDLDAEIAKTVSDIPSDRDTMPSGVEGWQNRLRNVYDSFDEFASFSDIYGLAHRLGYESAEEAWEANPIVRGSVNPSDYGVVENQEGRPPWYDAEAGAQPVQHDVEGAPVKIGQVVHVTSMEEGDENTEWAGYVGQEGKVVHLEYSCGCGQTYPVDPMIGVQFADGKVHEFWKEELAPFVDESVVDPKSVMEQATHEILKDEQAWVFSGPRGKREAHRPTTPFDVNNGYCEEWANLVVEHLPGAQVVDPGNFSGNSDDSLEAGHVFVLYRGKFYDAEATDGVSSWLELPYFTRGDYNFSQEALAWRPKVQEGIRAYHASPNRFRKFDLSKEGAHFGSQEQAGNVHKHGLHEPVPYDLQIKNPLRLRDIGVWNNFNNLHGALSIGDHITPQQADDVWAAWLRSDAEGWEALKVALEKNGYDGIVYQNEQEGPGDSYLVFRHGQIKRLKVAEDLSEDVGQGNEIKVQRSGDLVWIDWFYAHEPHLSGIGRAVYEDWETRLPKDIKAVRLQAVDATKGFWEKMGFSYVGEGSDLQMWKGVNGNPTPESIVEDLNDDVVAAAKDACKEPSDEQKEAGNYQKGHIVLQGLDLSLENAKGSMRRGQDKDGKEWEVKLPAHYGYIKGTEGKDKDHIDVFIGEMPESEKVYVVNQDKMDGGFDEHKVMLGFEERADAIQHYDDAYSDGLGEKLRGSVVSTTMEKFKAWLKDGEHKKPFKEVEPITERVSISDVFAYLETIRPKLDEARDAAAAAEPDVEKKQDILKGHGIYNGSCGHRIQGCRCAKACAVIEVEAPCRECGQKAPINEFVNKWRSQKIQEATDPEHMFQSRGYDCGPTCIKMVATALGVGRQLTLNDIIDACGSDPTTGTDDKKMEKGMAAAGVPFKVGAARTPEELATSLEAGHMIILRTLTRGIKHWIILYKFDGQRFHVQDPWLGPLSYTPEEVVNIWKPRDYFYFEVSRTMEQRVDHYQLATYAMLKSMNESQERGNLLFVNATGEIMPALEKAMMDVFPKQAGWVVEYSKEAMDPQLSVVVLEGHEVIGFYIVGRRSVGEGTQGMKQLEDLSGYQDKRGVEGIALGVVSSARGKGIGNRLKDYPKHLGVEYVWGLQMRSLNNLKDWLKRRRLVAESPECYATLEDL